MGPGVVRSPTLAADSYERTYQACNTAIVKLVVVGALPERTGKSYSRICHAPEVLQIMEG